MIDYLAVQLVISGIATGFTYALIAIGFTLIWKSSRVPNFAQGDLSVVGMFLALTFYVLWGWPLLLAIALSVLLTMLGTMVMEKLAIEPVREADPTVKIVVTLGLSMIIANGARIIYGPQPYAFPAFLGNKPFALGRLHIVPQDVWISVIVLLLIGALQLFFSRTMTGKAMRAVAERRDVASLMGVNEARMTTLAFGLAALLGAVAGVLLAPLIFVSADLSFQLVIKGLFAAVIGGFGSYPGALLGGLLIGVSDNLSAFFISSGYRDVVSFSILIALLLFRPTGLLGRRQDL